MANNTAGFVGMAAALGAAPTVDPQAVDQAFEALKSYDYGSGRASLMPIDEAVAGCAGNAAAREALERRLAEVLKTGAPAAAKDYVCRQLSLLGSAASVSALAELLTNKALSHMARFALERMPCPEAVQALRQSLPKLGGLEKVGVLQSLGMRRDAESLSALATAAGDADAQVAAAAVTALGELGTPESAQALLKLQPKAPAPVRLALADASLACAERLLTGGKKAEALALYKSLAAPEQPKHVRLAATRGMLVAAGGK